MAFIINIRKKKWLINGFALGTIVLILVGFLPPIYQTLEAKFRYIGVINGNRIYQSGYKQALNKTRDSKSGLSESKLHQTTWDGMVKKKSLEAMAEKLGISFDKKEANLEIKGYTKLVQAILKEDGKDKALAAVLSKEKKDRKNENMTDSEAFRSFIREEDSQYFMKKYLRPRVEEKLLEEKVKQLLPINHFQHHFRLPRDVGKKVSYYVFDSSQVPTSKDEVTEEKKLNYWNKHKDSYKDKNRTDVSYIHFPALASTEQKHTLETDLRGKKKEFKDASEPKVYARKNSDDTNNLIETWEKNKAPNDVKKLKVGEVSDVKMENNKGVLYRRMKDEKGMIRCVCITKKIDLEEKKHETKKKADRCVQLIKKTSWEAQTKKKGIEPEEISVTPEIANETLGEGEVLMEIARKVYAEKFYRGNPFIIEDADGHYVACVLKQVHNKTLQAQKEDIEAKVKNEIRVGKVKKAIKAHTLTGVVNKKMYGTLKPNSDRITVDSEQVGGKSCPKEIMHILNWENQDEPYVFCIDEKIFIVKIEKNIKNTNPYPSVKGKQIELIYNKTTPIKDYRYSYDENRIN